MWMQGVGCGAQTRCGRAFMHSLNKHFLSIRDVPGTVLGAGDSGDEDK